MTRERRGVRSEGKIEADQVWVTYQGLDSVIRQMRIQCDPAPKSLTPSEANFIQRLGPKEDKEFFLTYACQVNGSASGGLNYNRAHTAEAAIRRLAQLGIHTSNENKWLAGPSDLHDAYDTLLVLSHAGVPWFTRRWPDGIITALSTWQQSNRASSATWRLFKPGNRSHQDASRQDSSRNRKVSGSVAEIP
jgi:hypothetical protein